MYVYSSIATSTTAISFTCSRRIHAYITYTDKVLNLCIVCINPISIINKSNGRWILLGRYINEQ